MVLVVKPIGSSVWLIGFVSSMLELEELVARSRFRKSLSKLMLETLELTFGIFHFIDQPISPAEYQYPRCSGMIRCWRNWKFDSMNFKNAYDICFNDWPKFRPSWNFAMNPRSRITSRECIFFALSINSSVSVFQTWFCDEEITWLNYLPRYQITKHGDLTVQGHVIECFHICFYALHQPLVYILLIIRRIPRFLKFSRPALITPIRDCSVDTELIRREYDSEQEFRVRRFSIEVYGTLSFNHT